VLAGTFPWAGAFRTLVSGRDLAMKVGSLEARAMGTREPDSSPGKGPGTLSGCLRRLSAPGIASKRTFGKTHPRAKHSPRVKTVALVALKRLSSIEIIRTGWAESP